MNNYRPWLDGIRAIAVLMVVFCHLGPKYLERLGSTGVSIFFALSGYLITGLLLSEYKRSKDIQLIQFYTRRFLRLMPALFTVVVVCDFLYLITGSKTEVKSSFAALLYITNYATIAKGAHLPGFGHTWSLAVEEHFYLLWPPFLLYLLSRLSLRRTAFFVTVFCICLLAWRTILSQLEVDPRLLYVGSVERFDSILYGAVASLLAASGVRARSWWIWPGLIALIPSLYPVENPPYIVWSWTVLAIGTSAFLFAIDTLPGTAWRKPLSSPILTRIGVMSYGIYLWHIPLFEIIGRLISDRAIVTTLTVITTYLAAELSHRFIETPVRAWHRNKTLTGEAQAQPEKMV